MFDYLQQFNNLPKNLRDQVSSSQSMLVLSELENKYKIDLAMIVMKVMIRNIEVKNLPSYLISESGMTREAAESLTRDLKEKVFFGVAEHLGITSEIRALDLEKDIKIIITDAGLTLASSELVNRFKNILAIYLKGVRNKIDTRSVLAKEVIYGGLNLGMAEIDRVFKVCESQKFKSLAVTANASPSGVLSTPPLSTPPLNTTGALITPSAGRLDKIINSSEGLLSGSGKIADYNLKAMIESGQIKKPAQLDLPITEEQLDLPAAKSNLRLEKELKINEPVKIEDPIKKIEPIKKEEIKLVAPIITPVVPPIIPEVSPVSAPIKIQPIPIIPPKPAAARPVLNSVQNSNRPIMHDVKPMPKVMGPIEELQFFDVINFRRLGKTPAEAVTKIFNKVKQLEREGYDKMVSGVKAWRQSPVNRLYIKIGQEAISKGITVKEAALSRQKSNLEYLSIEEIEAIVGLNSKLVF